MKVRWQRSSNNSRLKLADNDWWLTMLGSSLPQKTVEESWLTTVNENDRQQLTKEHRQNLVENWHKKIIVGGWSIVVVEKQYMKNDYQRERKNSNKKAMIGDSQTTIDSGWWGVEDNYQKTIIKSVIESWLAMIVGKWSWKNNDKMMSCIRWKSLLKVEWQT